MHDHTQRDITFKKGTELCNFFTALIEIAHHLLGIHLRKHLTLREERREQDHTF